MRSPELTAFISAAMSCANEMLSNAEFIEKELPSVGLSKELESAVKRVCSDLVGTRFDVTSELIELNDPAVSDDPAAVQYRVDAVVRWLGQELPNLHAVVTSLQAARETDAGMGGYVLVAESATNILLSFRKVSEAADRYREAVRRQEASEETADGSAESRGLPAD